MGQGWAGVAGQVEPLGWGCWPGEAGWVGGWRARVRGEWQALARGGGGDAMARWVGCWAGMGQLVGTFI